jgi:hypothetical protein
LNTALALTSASNVMPLRARLTSQHAWGRLRRRERRCGANEVGEAR